jgi:hypothetical protein
VVQLLQCYLRAAELEMRAAEEPLKSGLDVAGLKTQVLGRIEELEARERERKGLLAGVGLNAAFGWWWADPVGALAMLPVIVWQGWETLGEAREGGTDGHDAD